MRIGLAVLLAFLLGWHPERASAEDRRVGAVETYSTIGAALAAAIDGDVVVVTAGIYDESVRTRVDGVTIRGEGAAASVVVRASGTVLRVDHDRIVVEGVTFDG